MYVVHWVPNGTDTMTTVQFASQDEADGYRSGLLAAGVALVSEVTISLS